MSGREHRLACQLNILRQGVSGRCVCKGGWGGGGELHADIYLSLEHEFFVRYSRGESQARTAEAVDPSLC